MKGAARLGYAEDPAALSGSYRAGSADQVEEIQAQRMGERPDRLRIADLHMPKNTLVSADVNVFFGLLWEWRRRPRSLKITSADGKPACCRGYARLRGP